MLVDDILGYTNGISKENIRTIQSECSQYLAESQHLPLFKLLPAGYNNFHKVKVRLKRHKTDVSDVFNKAFESQCVNFSQRAVFAYGHMPLVVEDNTDTFYILPTNGYKYIYSKEVTNSSNEYKRVIDTLVESFNTTEGACNVVTDLLKYTYTMSELYEGISLGAEIILYGIPSYYAIRTSTFKNYNQLIEQLP